MDDQYLADNLDFLEITKNKKKKKISYEPLPDDSMRSQGRPETGDDPDKRATVVPRESVQAENPQSRGRPDSDGGKSSHGES